MRSLPSGVLACERSLLLLTQGGGGPWVEVVVTVAPPSHHLPGTLTQR